VNKLVLAIALLLIVPCLGAQQEQPAGNPPQAAQQESTENSNVQNGVADAIKPGHELDPADVNILTGKRDRDLEASRQPGVSVVVGGFGYGNYGDPYAINRRGVAVLATPLLPLTRIGNPVFFFSIPPRSIGRGSFRGAR